MVRALVCWLCKEYIHIFPEKEGNLQKVQQFEQQHFGHPTQVVNLNELNSSYKRKEVV